MSPLKLEQVLRVSSFIERFTGSVFVNTKSRDCSWMKTPVTVPTCDLSFVPSLRGKLSRPWRHEVNSRRDAFANSMYVQRGTGRLATSTPTSLFHPLLCIEQLGASCYLIC